MLEDVPEHDRVERLVRHRLERLRSLQHRYPRFLGHPAREFGVPFESRGLPSEVSQDRSEEHTSELQSRLHLVCRLLLEKKKNVLSSRSSGEFPRTGVLIALARAT